ncbi:MAG: TAT-variant-translocated molybdopterin oxidoreductase [Bacteroidales bacterium]|nr:TAT-variant-translocated molybdopterin oxidoreductase [Bacteroidales bacterium]
MKKYWRSLNELQGNLSVDPEPEFSTTGISEDEIKGKAKTTRRDFLKLLGFGVGYATIAASCETPVNKAIPYLIKPDEVTVGIANYYASTFFDGHDYCSVLIKTREGRPIKIEGNELSSITKGETTARVQASVLNLYDSARYKNPKNGNTDISWDEADKAILTELNKIAEQGGKIVIFTSTVISPSTKKIFEDFKEKYPTTEVVYYDAVSYSAMLDANLKAFGKRVLPDYHFDKADLIVSFGADFLGNWISPIEFTKQYSSKRKPEKGSTKMSKHVQFESTMTLTGSNADYRIPIKPSDEVALLIELYNKLAAKAGAEKLNGGKAIVNIDTLASELWENKGKSLVVCGTNDVNNQYIVNAINNLLENYGNTIDINTPLLLKQGNDAEAKAIVEEMNAGKISAIFFNNSNPVYDYPEKEKFVEGLKKVALSVSFASSKDETSQLCTYICPDNNYLESWNDAEPKLGHYSLAQPTIHQLFDTRQMQDSLLKWLGKEAQYYDYIQQYWEKEIFPKQNGFIDFTAFWNQSLHDGVFETKTVSETATFNNSELTDAANKANKEGEGIELLVYESIGIGNGTNANNPWLQELPDPVSKVCWDNYLAVSYNYAKSKGLELGDIVKVNDKFEIPVLIQPGQADETVAIAMGYGRTNAGLAADGVGQNAFTLLDNSGDYKNYVISGVKIEKTGKNHKLALTQEYHTMQGRDIVHETSLDEYTKNPTAGNEAHVKHEENKPITLYPGRTYEGHHWGLALDLNACTGCSACVIACQAENNVPVIGRDEVINRRIMHWMRIDRYYSEQAENPEVFYMPVMCQHCDNAPCENVCPVAATPHSDEGLNQMAYNRCIGTRYCMNNCPYRVRRFNWYQYTNNQKYSFTEDLDLSRMVLNPDVLVRTRGVVEKCTMCVQRIQEGKLNAKKENRPLRDGEIKPACLQACAADAIIFGDLNDKESKIAKAYENERNYHLLEELHTLPSVGYLTKVRNNSKKDFIS